MEFLKNSIVMVKEKIKPKEWLPVFNGFPLRKKIIVITAILLVLVILSFLVFGRKDNVEKPTYSEYTANIGNITETIEQSGVIEPYERYEITSLAKGEIISSPVEEGDLVEEGDTLYRIDDEDAQLNIEKSQNNVEKSQIALNETYENVSNLNIYAPSSGKLTEFSLKVGDDVAKGIIGKIANSEKVAVDIPFSTGDYNKISVGDSVTVTSALYMTSLSGRVTHKYTANADSGYSGSLLKNIEIEIENPGALADGTSFAATVHTNSGDVNSAGSGIIDGGTTTSLKAEVSGEVAYVAVKEGDYVRRGQLIASLNNESLVNSVRNGELSLKDSQLSLKSSQKTLENYNITAPISGTVITKNSKAGDKIDNSNSQTVMMVIADVSKMKFTITVDELDIADIKLGQSAIVDADAIPDTQFDARVTSIAAEGVSSGDGVTTFTVELTIDEPGELKSGMNVNANILINEAYDVVRIPEEALMSVKGNSATVLVKSNGKKNKNAMKNDEKPIKADIPNMPNGYEIRQVVIGVSDGTSVEIVSGISEGEIVAYIPSSIGNSNPFAAMMGGMMRNAHGGGMPGGGMPGGGSRNGGGMSGGRQ